MCGLLRLPRTTAADLQALSAEGHHRFALLRPFPNTTQNKSIMKAAMALMTYAEAEGAADVTGSAFRTGREQAYEDLRRACPASSASPTS